MTVLVADRRIAALGGTGTVSLPSDAEIVDASGKFLIPGLWDMHVHALVESRLATFFPLFLANGVTGVRNTPTVAALGDTSGRDDPALRYLLRGERERGDPRRQPVFRDLPRQIARGYTQVYPRQVELARVMHRAGVKFLAGTDTPVMLLVPGFRLHDELQAFVDAAFSPADALRAATLGPARFLGRDRDLGTIAKGKLADVVLLDADPLADIRNTRRIAAVIVNGR